MEIQFIPRNFFVWLPHVDGYLALPKEYCLVNAEYIVEQWMTPWEISQMCYPIGSKKIGPTAVFRIKWKPPKQPANG